MYELCTLPFVLLGVLIARCLPPTPPRDPDGFTVEKQEKATQVWGDLETGRGT